jgi:hypothetical protein
MQGQIHRRLIYSIVQIAKKLLIWRGKADAADKRRVAVVIAFPAPMTALLGISSFADRLIVPTSSVATSYHLQVRRRETFGHAGLFEHTRGSYTDHERSRLE